MNAEQCDARWRETFRPLEWPEDPLKQVLAVRAARGLGGRGRDASWLSRERFGGVAPVEQVEDALQFLNALEIDQPLEPKPLEKRVKLPRGLADRNWELRRELQAVGQPMTAKELSERFLGITAKAVEECLDALCLMGMAFVLVPFDEFEKETSRHD